MKKIYAYFLGVICWLNTLVVFSAEKFEILPDLPEPLQAAQASSVSSVDTSHALAAQQSIGQEPNLISIVFSLLFVVLLIYATGIIYTKLNKLGITTLKQQMGDVNKSRVSVISTTPLGSNKSLHVVELDGKRMLIGASSTSIHLIKDLGVYPHPEISEDIEYSKIEIPNIRIPKIEIPKIEFPNIGFTKATPKAKTKTEQNIDENSEQSYKFEISDIYEEDSDGIIDKLFQSEPKDNEEAGIDKSETKVKDEHKVDPEDYVLYKKYL